MKTIRLNTMYGWLAVATLLMTLAPAQAEKPSADDTVSVSMTVTASVADGKRMPNILPNDIQVRSGKERLQVTDWSAARGNRAGLDLFILIDDASDPILGLQLDDLRKFIADQPATTRIGVGYMRNATLQIAQDFTSDHGKAAASVRLPLGSAGAYGSAYRSAVDLMKRWPESGNRREILMLTDGVDRMQPRSWRTRGFQVNAEVDLASKTAQKTGTMIHTIYVPGAGRIHRNYWTQMNGQMDAARLADETGGESYYLGLGAPVTIAPYLAELQGKLENQYILSVAAKPGKKAGLQSVQLSTEVAGVELATHDAVWVPASR